MADRPELHEASSEVKERILRASRAIRTALAAIGASRSEGLNALAMLLAYRAIKEGVSLGQLLVLLRSNWTVFDGPPTNLNEAAAEARQAGMEDLALTLEAESVNAPQRPVRELRGNLKTMRRRRGN